MMNRWQTIRQQLIQALPCPRALSEVEQWCQLRLSESSVLSQLGADIIEFDDQVSVVVGYQSETSIGDKAAAFLSYYPSLSRSELREQFRDFYPEIHYQEASLLIAMAMDPRIRSLPDGRFQIQPEWALAQSTLGLSEIKAQVEKGQCPQQTLRQLLQAFGVQRRGVRIVSQIKAQLDQLELTTRPDILQADLDSQLTFFAKKALTSKRAHRGFKVSREGKFLKILVDLSQSLGPTSQGTALLVASSQGAIDLGDDLRLTLRVERRLKSP